MTDQLTEMLKNMKYKDAAAPSVTFRKNARIRILNGIPPKASPQHSISQPFFFTPLRFAFLLLLFVGWTLYASQTSIPATPLYPIKILGERIALSLAPTVSMKTTIANTIVGRRLEEIQDAQSSGDQKNISQSVVNYDRDVNKILNMKDISREKIENTISEHSSLLQKTHEEKNSQKQKKSRFEDTQDESGQSVGSQDSETAAAPTPTPLPETIQSEREPFSTSTQQNDTEIPDIKGTNTEKP